MPIGLVVQFKASVSMIVILKYGLGNTGSIVNMLKKLGHKSVVSDKAEDIQNASKLILPGVGSFDYGMQNLNASGHRALLEQKVVQDKVPVLGICLGMQLMTRGSEEGTEAGLGWVDAQTVKVKVEKPLRVPHMGWNLVQPAKDSSLTHGFSETFKYYFVHSYKVKCNNPDDVLLRTTHGAPFDSGFHKDNIYGVQFHPEKSHRFGLHLLKNFAEAC